MRLSVIIPNYNDLRVRRAVASVRSQTYTNYELLVIDGGSTADELLEYYRSCAVDRVLIEMDHGIFDALNKGVRMAQGDVVFLMGADDELSDARVFEDVVASFRRGGTLDGVCIGCEFVNAQGKIIRTWYPRSVSAARMRLGVLPPHFSLFLRRELYAVVGEFEFHRHGNVACDSIWLLNLATRKPDVRIAVLKDHHLKMEYGGASTRSLRAIAKQFRVVHEYARQNARHLPLWFLLSPLKTLSKVWQLRPFRI